MPLRHNYCCYFKFNYFWPGWVTIFPILANWIIFNHIIHFWNDIRKVLWLRRFAVMLSQLTIFQISVEYRSETYFLLKPFEFCYFLVNLFDPASIAVVWFCSFIFIFSLFFCNKFLKPTFCQRNFWKILIAAKDNNVVMKDNNGCL